MQLLIVALQYEDELSTFVYYINNSSALVVPFDCKELLEKYSVPFKVVEV